MKKTKILVIMSLVLSLLVGAIPNVGTSVEAASNIPDVKVAFINVCDENVGNSEGKADATLIQANNQLVLVDCGTKDTYDHLKSRITKRYANILSQWFLFENSLVAFLNSSVVIPKFSINLKFCISLIANVLSKS